jgi:hypothetical protein
LKERERRMSYGKKRKKTLQLLDDLKENRGYWKLKEEVIDRAL